jgi:phage tail-like protein
MDRARIARLLPETYQSAIPPETPPSDPAAVVRKKPLAATLEVMEMLQAPAESALASLDAHVDPLRAPPNFVLMLARWLDLDRYLDWTGGRPGDGAPRYAAGLGRLRLLCLEAAELARWRGTRRTLERFLTVATGVSGYTVEENPPGPKGVARCFHLRVVAPAAAQPLADLVRRIVDEERPAYTTYEIEFSAA